MVGSQRDKGVNEERRNKNRNRNKKGRKRSKKCKKQKYRDYFIEEHGCRSKRPYKMAKCVGKLNFKFNISTNDGRGCVGNLKTGVHSFIGNLILHIHLGYIVN